jgi:hypothetical protein
MKKMNRLLLQRLAVPFSGNCAVCGMHSSTSVRSTLWSSQLDVLVLLAL